MDVGIRFFFVHVKIIVIHNYLNMSKNSCFEKKTYLVSKKFNLSFFDMCNPRHMYSVIKHYRKIVCRRFGPVQLKFYFLYYGVTFGGIPLIYYIFVTAGVQRNCKPAGDFLKLPLLPQVTKNFVCNTGI